MTTYPIALPTATISQPISTSFRIRRVVGTSQSTFTGQQQVYRHQGEWWEADARTARGTAGSSAGTPLVNGASQTGNTLIIDGATASQTGYLKAGDYIQLGTGITQRLHMVIDDANSDGSGNVTLNIEPALRSSPDNNLGIVVANTKGVFRLASNETNWEANAVSTYGLTFAVKEYLA